MQDNAMRRRIGTREVDLLDVEHVRIFHDPGLYAGHPNRGGMWNFGDGEIAVAHRVKTVDYGSPAWKAAGSHDFSQPPHGQTFGIMLNRSFDHGRTWPDSEKEWIYRNDRSLDELLDWLSPVDGNQREHIDMSDPSAIMHFSATGEHLRWPLGGAMHPRLDPNAAFHLGKRPSGFMPTLCVRSADRGRTWEDKPTLIEGPTFAPDGGFLAANLGHVRFDNGVLGIVGTTNNRNISCFYASYDDGISWEFVSEIARGSTPDPERGYTYMGLHTLPDGRLMVSMHRMTEDWPCVAFSDDDGMTWSDPRYIVSPATYASPLVGDETNRAIGDHSSPRYRSPCALVTREGRIVVVFARRSYPARGSRGILGVVSDDLGETWSREFVLRGDAYTWDCGYPVLTELDDGRLFVAYYITTQTDDNPQPEYAVVRHIAGTFFRLD